MPGQEELDERMMETMRDELDELSRQLTEEYEVVVQKDLGIHDILLLLGKLLREVAEQLAVEIEEYLDDVDYPTVDLEEFKEEMRRRMNLHWTRAASMVASELGAGAKRSFEDAVEMNSDEIVEATTTDNDVETRIDELAKAMKVWVEQRGD